ncbi:MAG: hypothetical protein IRZ16_16430 [Myxococcaceae bacterium]|nr:hypothetical protein [Myxococcaceae bacterium]
MAAALVALAGCVSAPTQPAVARAEALMASAPKRKGDVELHCEPEDADVAVDGVPQGLCADFAGRPDRLVLGEGLHRIDVKKPGFRPYQTYYQAGGARAVLTIALVPNGPAQGAGL